MLIPAQYPTVMLALGTSPVRSIKAVSFIRFRCLCLSPFRAFCLPSLQRLQTMSRLSHHANARGSVSTSKSQPLPSASQTLSSTRDRTYYQRLGSQGSETQDCHVPLARSRPSSGHSLHGLRAPRTPPASMSYMDTANFSPSVHDYEAADVHNLRTGTFSFGRPVLRPTSGGAMSPAQVGTSMSPQRPPRTAPDNPLPPGVNQAGQGRPPTPLEPQTTHIRAWLHRLETSVNSIRHEFEAFRASTEGEKEGRILMRDAMSSTLEACRQIPQVLQAQNDDHAKHLASELRSLLTQHQGGTDPATLKKLHTFEQKLADLERRTSTSTAMLSSRIEEMTAAVRSQASLLQQGLTATASFGDHVARMLEADRKQREASFSALSQKLERHNQVKTPESSEPPSVLERRPNVLLEPMHKTTHGARTDPKASDEDIGQSNSSVRTSASHPDEEPLLSFLASQAPLITYGNNNNRHIPASLGEGERLVVNEEPVAPKRSRKRQRSRASSSRKRKRTAPKEKKAQLSELHTGPLDETGAFAIPVPEPRPRPRKSDSRKRFETSTFSIPSRFPPSRAAKKPDLVYIHPN